jgi:hypothetical protein
VPFKSEAQRRLFHAKAARGEISQETVHEWEHATKNKKKLPMHVKKSYDQGANDALALFGKVANIPGPTLSQRAASALVQGGSSLALNAAMAQEGDKARQAGIGGVSDALGGFFGGFKGMGASMATNMALQGLTAPKQHGPPPQDPRWTGYEPKLADHADDRLKERIKADFPADALQQLRAQAIKLDLSPGKYYLPMKDSSGNTAAIAAFKTVGDNNKLVLATVLNPKSKPPPGTSLSHLMKQPIGKVVGKVDASPKQYQIRKTPDGRLTCSCKDFKYRQAAAGGTCKHIDAHMKVAHLFLG